MRKLLNQPWFVGVLALGAIVFCTLSLREQLGGKHSGTARLAAGIAPEAEASDAASSDESSVPTAEGTTRSIPAVLAALVFPATIPDPFTRRDATLVAGDPEEAPSPTLPDVKDSIRLTAVWQQGDIRLAVVNDRIVRSGDQVGRLKIDEISVDGLWVSHWKGRDFVSFGGDFTLLTPADGSSTPSLALHEM